MDVKGLDRDKLESRLYVGNLDFRISESDVIKMFSPFGKITAEDFLWHTRGPKRGEPRGYAFVQYTTKEEAQLAKEKMNGKFVCGRPMVVHLASEKCSLDSSNSPRVLKDKKLSGGSGGKSGQTDRAAKIAAIKNKLKSLEGEGCSSKRPRLKPDDLHCTEEQSHKKDQRNAYMYLKLEKKPRQSTHCYLKVDQRPAEIEYRRSQARVKEEGCDRLGEPASKPAILWI